MITENQPDNSHDSTTTANNRRDKCTKKRCDNSDNKKETQLPDATTMQGRTMINKCVIGDSNMRGLATQLKSGVGMCIQNFWYENSTHNYPITRICK